MKLLISISTLLISLSISAQTFSLNDTSFAIGDVYNIGKFDYYICGRFNIDPNKQKKEQLLNFLKKNLKLSVEIQSHTDQRGTASYNLKLSQRRADNIVAYLVEEGIDKGRLKAVGKGEAEPLISEKEINEIKDVEQKELAHAKNRRLLMKIVAIN